MASRARRPHADPRQGDGSPRESWFTALGGTNGPSHGHQGGLVGSLGPEGWGKARPNTRPSQEAWLVAGCASGRSGTPSTQLQPADRAPVCPMSTPSTRPSIHSAVTPHPPHPPHTPPTLPASFPPAPNPPPAHTASSQVHQLHGEVS